MPGPQGNSLFIPSGPAPTFEDWLKTDPFYSQDVANINTWQTDQLEDINFDETWFNQEWQNDWNAANAQYDPNYDYGLGNAQAQTALQLQKAEHDNAMRAEYLGEWMASRGLHDSGQNALEQNERAFQHDMGVQGINLNLQGTEQEISHQKTQAQNALSAALARLTTSQGKALAGFAEDRSDVAPEAGRQMGQAGMRAYQRANDSGALKQPGTNAIWDEDSQLYVTADGKYYTVVNGVPVLTTWSPTTVAGPNNYGGTGYTGEAPPPENPASPTDYTQGPVYQQAPGGGVTPVAPGYQPPPGQWLYT